MEFRIRVNLDNAAFYEANPEEELQRVITKAVTVAMNTPCGPNGLTGKVLDSNGNSVGSWVVTN